MAQPNPPNDENEIISLLREIGVPEDQLTTDVTVASPLASDYVLARPAKYTLLDLVEQLGGTDADEVARGFAHLGVVVPDHDTVMFSEADVELARFLQVATDNLLTSDEGTQVIRVVGVAVSNIAEAAVAGHVQGIEARLSEPVDFVRTNIVMAELGLELGRLLEPVFRHHLNQAALRQRSTMSATSRLVVVQAVGFVDLVGFTQMSATLEAHDLAQKIGEFEGRVHELAEEHVVRVVKLIGDQVMFSSTDALGAARYATALVTGFSDDTIQGRGGVACGDLINLHGDYFGVVVNRAARLMDNAVPGEVLVDRAVADTDGVNAEPAGRRLLKGFSEPESVFSL